jgi:hypothetical protein
VCSYGFMSSDAREGPIMVENKFLFGNYIGQL